MPFNGQKEYRDRNGNLMKCPRCGSYRITTTYAGSRSVERRDRPGKGYYCRNCTRVFTFDRINHPQVSGPTPKNLLSSYVRFSKGYLVWSNRYCNWFYRLDKSSGWQLLERQSFIDEVKIYLSQNHKDISPTFFKRCIRYLKDRLGDEAVNPDPFAYSLGHPPCPRCGALHTMKKGKTPKGRSKYHCVNCQRSFNIIPSPSPPTNSTNEQKTQKTMEQTKF